MQDDGSAPMIATRQLPRSGFVQLRLCGAPHNRKQADTLAAFVQEALAACQAKAGDFTEADVARVDEIERTTKHDVIAFLTFMEERIGPAARWLHWGMTSSDVLDSSLALILRDAATLILTGVERVMKAVSARAQAEAVKDA